MTTKEVQDENLTKAIYQSTIADSRVKWDADFLVGLKGKKVLLATESLGPINGVSKTTRQLIDYLGRHEIDIAVVAPEISPSKITTSQLTTASLRLYGWPLPYNPDLTIVYPFRIDRVFRRTFCPDVIYLASPASVGFQILLQARFLWNAPPILCNFQTDLSSYSETIFPARMAAFAVWLLGVVQGYLFNGRAVQTVFYPCSDIQQYLTSTGTDKRKLIHLGRGVDTDMFNPSKRDELFRLQHAPTGEPILLCVSRIAPEKGFQFLAQATIKLATVLKFKLVIVGGNRNPSVQAEIQKCFDPIKDRTVFLGFLTGVPLAQAYASADIFLHCSITETFGLVVLESMASGVPVVARDQGGPSEIVRHGKTGYLVAPDDLETFVERVKSVCEDNALRRDFAQNSRQFALESTWERINHKAAWYMAQALRAHDAQKVAPVEMRFHVGLWTSVLELLRLWFAVMVVSVFWIIACLPLIVHGSLTFQIRQTADTVKLNAYDLRIL